MDTNTAGASVTPAGVLTANKPGHVRVTVTATNAGVKTSQSALIRVPLPAMTPPTTVAGGPSPTVGAAGLDRSIAIKRATLRVDRKRHVKVRIKCGPSRGTRCAGIVQILWTGRRLFARRSFTIPSGAYRNITLSVTAEVYKRLKPHTTLHVSVILLTRGSDGVLRRAEERHLAIKRSP